MKQILTSIIIILLIVSPLAAQQYTASIAQMPVYAESMEKGVLVDLIKAIEVKSGKKITYQVVPFKRSMDNVINSKVDFHLPLIQNPNIKEDDLNYDHSTATIFHVNFVLYFNKNKTINRDKWTDYTIETDAAHVQYFDFPVVASTNLESSLKKLNMQRIDGFIFADFASDPIVKANNLNNIRRELYDTFDVKIILQQDKKGSGVDTFLNDIITKMRETGEYQKIMDVIDAPYNNWQPE